MTISADELAATIVGRLLTFLRYQHRFGDKLFRTLGISGRQLTVLRYLAREGPRSVSEIGRHLYVGDATTSSTLERMEANGLVVRRRATQDARRVLVEITDKGRQVGAEAPSGPMTRLRDELPHLDPQELADLDRALVRLLEISQVDESLIE